MQIIDAHAHFAGVHPDCLAMLQELDLRMINICVAEKQEEKWREQQAVPYKKLAKNHPERYAWCTTIDIPRFDDPNYVKQVIADLEKDLDSAIACKVWKNLGMTLKDPSGNFFMIDDPLLDPVFRHLEKTRKPLVMHMAEPISCWQPPHLHTPEAHEYFTKHPEYYLYEKAGAPSHEDLMLARDHVIERYPGLTVVGAHYGSLDHDFREIAKRFERYPNFVVDTSARIAAIARQDREVVKQFFIEYQDRIMYGSDIILDIQSEAATSETGRSRKLENLKNITETMQMLLGTEEKVIYRGREMNGLGLPKEVTEKVFFSNTLRWFPDLKW